MVDLNIGITLTIDLHFRACSLLALLRLALFWKIKLKNNLGKIRVNFEIFTGIFRSVFRNFGFIIIKL